MVGSEPGLFQFHMVRLKGWKLSDMSRITPEFQFHMVRLKDFRQRDHHAVYKFQFHMVRLKAGMVKEKDVSEEHFNSTWYD